MMSEKHTNEEAAYITIVEGPPPEFIATNKYWTASLGEGFWSIVAKCEMRTLDGELLVGRCQSAWATGRAALLDYPQDPLNNPSGSSRATVEIVAARWENVVEGQKLVLWVKTDDAESVTGYSPIDV